MSGSAPKRLRYCNSGIFLSPCGTHPATTRLLPRARPWATRLLIAAWLGFFTVQVLMTQQSASSLIASFTSLLKYMC